MFSYSLTFRVCSHNSFMFSFHRIFSSSSNGWSLFLLWFSGNIVESKLAFIKAMAFEEEKSNLLSLDKWIRRGREITWNPQVSLSFPSTYTTTHHATHGPRHMGNPNPPQKNVSSNFKTKKFHEDYIFKLFFEIL